MNVVARNALPYRKWWPHDAFATQIFLHLQFEVYNICNCLLCIVHEYWTSFSLVISFHCSVCHYVVFILIPDHLVELIFYNVTNLFVPSFAFGIKIHMLMIRRIYAPYYQELRRGRIYQMKLFESEWKGIKDTTYRKWKIINKNSQGISEHKMSGFVLHFIKFCVQSEYWTSEYKFRIK